MECLNLLEKEIESITEERREISEDILSISRSISDSLSTSLQNHCDKMFDIWIQELNNNGLCKHESELFLHKIPYTSASGYKIYPLFKQPGIYLWGRDDIPRYIGKTEKSFEKRLFNRYIPRKNGTTYKSPTQCGISEILRDYYSKPKLGGFKKKLESYDKNDKKMIKERIEKDLKITIRSYERLYGALDFSQFEKESIWFAILPFEDTNKKFIDIFETLFIHSAQKYNKKNGYDELLNKGKIDSE
ncbi:hypothetical protein MSMTP_1445 [Methanosarcina sp. MTP4]|nr:hypothetical protein MSMTP_1445 [Methanosarcina sp. MTP4]